MARSNDSAPLGRFRGNIGPYIFTVYRGIQVVKSKPKKRNKRRKPKASQVEKNKIFSAVQRILSLVKSDINIGFQLPKNSGRSSFNAAMSYHLEYALTDGVRETTLDLTKLKFSDPQKQLQGAWNVGINYAADGNLTVSWELNPTPQKETRMDDCVRLLFYQKDIKTFFTPYGLQRNDLCYTFDLARISESREIYCYLYLYSADLKRVSETEFLGKLEMQA